MDKQKMIDKIYEVIADKTVNFWCKIKYREKHEQRRYYRHDWWQSICWQDQYTWCHWERYYKREIIWHPVMIGDVLDWMENNITKDEYALFHTTLGYRRRTKCKPIEEQSEECIKFIYDLITK